MTRIVTAAAAAAALAATGAAPAPAVPAVRINALARSYVALPNVPSASIAVVQNGKIVYLRSFGYRNLAEKLPANPDTLYDTASLGKQFTAAVFLMLAKEGKIDLHTRVSKYLPKMPHANEVTLEQLMWMTAGYQDVGSGNPPKDAAPMDELTYYAGLPLHFKPGTQYRYSNTNYELMGAIIQKVSGKPYAQVMRERLFGPLHMTSWRMVSPHDVLANRAIGYVYYTPVRAHIDPSTQHATTLGASGSFRLSMRDLAKWDADLFEHRVVPASVWKEMSTPGHLNDGTTIPYGGGEVISTFNGHRLVAHSGGHTDANTDNWVFPADRLAIAVFTNAGWTQPAPFESAIAAQYLGLKTYKPDSGWDATSAEVPAAVSAAARKWLTGALAGAMKPSSNEQEALALEDYAAAGKRYGTVQQFTPTAWDPREFAFFKVTLHGKPFTYLYVGGVNGFGLALLPAWQPPPQ